MVNIEKKTNPIVARGECADCGATVNVKLNKNNNAYYFCVCGHKEGWSREGTKKIVEAFNKKSQLKQEDKPKQQENKNDKEFKTDTSTRAEPKFQPNYRTERIEPTEPTKPAEPAKPTRSGILSELFGEF